MTYNVLFVDDEENSLKLLNRIFRKQYNIFEASTAHEALEIIQNNKIDLIITDQRMPGMSGVELLEKVAEINPDMIRLLVTAYTDAKVLIQAINSGNVYKYIKKPWHPDELKLTVERALLSHQLSSDNKRLIEELKDIFSGTIKAITGALDAKDSYTYGRSMRVTSTAVAMGQYLNLETLDLRDLELAGLLHDIGMIGVPERVLHKTEKLTDEELEIIRSHVHKGMNIISNIKQLASVAHIIYHHHERYDGSGYPDNLVGDDIPLLSQIIAVADTYDSMTSERAYRKGLPEVVAAKEIKKLSGIQFSPQIVETFLTVIHYEDLKMNQRKKPLLQN